MTETLANMVEDRDDNRKLLEQKKSSITKQISAVKSKLLKDTDDLRQRLIQHIIFLRIQNNISRHVQFCFFLSTDHIHQLKP
jgi:hypothetical protein